jgi:hypothetical protein
LESGSYRLNKEKNQGKKKKRKKWGDRTGKGLVDVSGKNRGLFQG